MYIHVHEICTTCCTTELPLTAHASIRVHVCRYMVDAADHEKLDASKNELHSLLEKPQLAGIPVSNSGI